MFIDCSFYFQSISSLKKETIRILAKHGRSPLGISDIPSNTYLNSRVKKKNKKSYKLNYTYKKEESGGGSCLRDWSGEIQLGKRFFFFLKFIYPIERENAGGSEKEGERASKSGSPLSAQSLMQTRTHKPCNHDEPK